MGFFWVLLTAAFLVAAFMIGFRYSVGRRSRPALRPESRADGPPKRDLGANINPSQHGNERDLWPDRTGARTRRELGAKDAANVTFVGDREERRGAEPNQAQGAMERVQPQNDRRTYGSVQSDPTKPVMQAGVRREVQPGPHEHGPGTNPAADLAPEDEFGEDRPANRTTAPDQPPTQWHPDQHGDVGDHLRDGHHTSGAAPEKISTAQDPYAHAPVPGPNHIIPDSGDELRPGTRP